LKTFLFVVSAAARERNTVENRSHLPCCLFSGSASVQSRFVVCAGRRFFVDDVETETVRPQLAAGTIARACVTNDDAKNHFKKAADKQ